MVYINRDKTELIASILEATNGRSLNASQIMYKSFLSYTQLKRYVLILIDAGLIKYQEANRRRAYRITDNGMRFLDLHNKITELVTDSSSSRTNIIMD